MENKRNVQENAYEEAFMKRHGEEARAGYEKRMQDKWGKKSFAFYDADGNIHTIDFVPGMYTHSMMLDNRHVLGLEKTNEQNARLYRMDRRFWIATCIQAVAVLALAVTVLLHVL